MLRIKSPSPITSNRPGGSRKAYSEMRSVQLESSTRPSVRT